MDKNSSKINSLWRRVKPFLIGDSRQKQDIVLKTGQGHLDLTLVFLGRSSGHGILGRM
ncbi:MAG: hypothetical protein ABSD38_05610 [Syntrophorhabdales bacterium]|jgi:hypothetical protein